jgi:phage gp45-like
MNVERLARRVLMMVGLPYTSAPATETGSAQVLQLTHHNTGEQHDGVVSLQMFGFASSPMPGCDHLVVYAEGDRTKGFAVASNDQRVRPKGMAAGESQQYDNAGQRIYLKAGTAIVVNAKTEIDFQINGTLVGKFTSAGLAVTGAITATGNITAGFGGGDQIDMQHHTHTYNPGGGAPTPTTAPIAGT